MFANTLLHLFFSFPGVQLHVTSEFTTYIYIVPFIYVTSYFLVVFVTLKVNFTEHILFFFLKLSINELFIDAPVPRDSHLCCHVCSLSQALLLPASGCKLCTGFP